MQLKIEVYSFLVVLSVLYMLDAFSNLVLVETDILDNYMVLNWEHNSAKNFSCCTVTHLHFSRQWITGLSVTLTPNHNLPVFNQLFSGALFTYSPNFMKIHPQLFEFLGDRL